MSVVRTPGPAGTSSGQQNRLPTSEQTNSPTATYSQPGPAKSSLLTPEQEELALDISQMVLDIVGIFEPTPFADGANALISLGRREWLNAGLSSIGMIPYIGDLAKAGKLPGYAQKIQRAIQLAKQDARFASYLRPVLAGLRDALEVAQTNLSPAVARQLDAIKRPIDSFLASFKNARRVWWEVLAEGPPIKGTSIPEWIRMRVGKRKFEIMRNKSKLDNAGKPIGPATKHLGEKAADANEWAKISQVDFPMSSLAGALEEAEKRLVAGKAGSGKIFTVEAWELGINTTKEPWVVYHAVYNPKIK